MINEYVQLKGRIRGYALAKKHKKPVSADTINKCIQTELNKGTVTISEINNMFFEVERDTINALNWSRDYESIRGRFEVLKEKVIPKS